MPKVGGRKRSPLRNSLREEILDSRPTTIPDSHHIGHKPILHLLQTQPFGHLPRGTIVSFVLILISLMAAVVGSLTWAYFSDTASTAATFSSGTANLLICDALDCYQNYTVPAIEDIYPGWSETVSLRLYNSGSLRMKVFIIDEEVTDEGLGAVVSVEIYKAASVEGSPIWSGTFDELEVAEPIEYGDLDSEAYGDITFFFEWPESGADDTSLARASLSEQITFTGTTEGVEQP